MSKLLIVESPAKAKTIAKYLGTDFVVKASMGHLRDLPKKKMGVDIDDGFKPHYIPIEGKEKMINELRAAADEADFVYLATDPDREGEAISWHLKELLMLGDHRSKRVTFNEITKPAVQLAMKNPRDIDIDLVNSQQARRILDRVVGYQLSPFLWRKVKRGLSAGRVQSVTTRLVVDREQEIRAFIPEEYWSIETVLKTADNGTFNARFYGNAKGKIELKTEQQTMEIVNAVKDQPFNVKSIKKGKKKRTPSAPFITSSLQQDASRKLNMTPRRTMSVAQELYEGVEIDGHGLQGLITYMRTDSLRLSDEATSAAADYIKARYGDAYYTGKPRVYKTKGGAQDAHEAIRPSDVNLDPESIRNSLSVDQYKLYKLIWSRFVACQMSDAILDTISADIYSADYMFRASGYTVAFQGFTAVYVEATDDDSSDSNTAKALPVFAEGDNLIADKISPAQHFTQPPARYTEASLIRAMEERGIGRPSTYAPTISTIESRAYVEKENKALRPTKLGEGVTGLLVDKFDSIADYKFTAKMENELDEVEAGKLDYIELLENFYKGFNGALEQAEIDLKDTRIKIEDEVTDVICELCGKNMVKKMGRFGKFLACPGFPECSNTKAITEDTGAACPVCGTKVVKKKSAKGYVYYSCDKYPACNFITWDKPLKTKCAVCDSSLFRHTDRDSKEVTDICLREGCGFSELVKEGLPPEEAEKNRLRREARAEKARERAEKLEAEGKATKKATTKKTATKKTTTAKKTTKKAKDAEADGAEVKTTRKKAATKTTAKKATTTKKTTTRKKAEEKVDGETPKAKTTRKTATKKVKTEESEDAN